MISTPSTSNIILPGCTLQAQNSTDPLPLPILTSAGFLVTGTSGTYYIINLIKEFKKLHPGIDLKIISSKVENGVATESTQVFEGTKDEMMYKLEELKLEGKILKKKATEDKGIE